MKLHYDKKHREVEFKEEDLVLLKLPTYRQQSLASRGNAKLSPRYYGPFKVLAKVGQVAYKLHLPENLRTHPIFHVSSLKKFKGGSFSNPVLPPPPLEEFHPSPMAVLDKCMNQGKSKVLVHWEGLSPAEASWEDTAMLTAHFPSFVFEDNHDFQGGADVRDSIHGPQPNSNKNRAAKIKDVLYQRFTHGKFRK
ncbi:uncharacterized protein LOC142532312 [Primulina tabacum]|uniref:uncharacterized protein LOC142532312 n=1 Tax=Primulina tabacum TaxID=48773 RepID=UPI003F5A29CE